LLTHTCLCHQAV